MSDPLHEMSIFARVVSAGSLIRDIQQFQHSLNRSVLAVGAVQNDERGIDFSRIGHQFGQIGLGVVAPHIVFGFVQCLIDLFSALQGSIYQ